MDATLRQRAAGAGPGAAGTAAAAAAAAAAGTAAGRGTSRAAQPAAAAAEAPSQQRRPPPARVSAAEQAAAAREVDAAAALASSLEALFADPQHPPDLEAGCMAAVHVTAGASGGGGGGGSNGSSGSGSVQAQSLVRVDLGATRGGARRGLGPRFLLVPASLAEALADAPGDDQRLSLLEALPDCRLKRRPAQALPAAGALDAVLRARKQQQQGGKAPGGGGGGGGGARAFLIPQRS